MIRRSFARWAQPLTIVAALSITVLSVWLLGMLNARAVFSDASPNQIRTVVLQGADSPAVSNEQRKSAVSDPKKTQPEIMEVVLDPPEFEPLAAEPLDLEFQLPSPTVIPLQIVASQPQTQPTKPLIPPSPSVPPLDRLDTTTAAKPLAKPPAKPQAKPTTSPTPAPSVQGAGRIDQPPRELRSNPAPTYPVEQLRDGIEGTVTLRLLIDENGMVENVKIVDGDEVFVRAALAVVYRWRFSPARHEGKAVKVWGLKKFRFSVRRS